MNLKIIHLTNDIKTGKALISLRLVHRLCWLAGSKTTEMAISESCYIWMWIIQKTKKEQQILTRVRPIMSSVCISSRSFSVSCRTFSRLSCDVYGESVKSSTVSLASSNELSNFSSIPGSIIVTRAMSIKSCTNKLHKMNKQPVHTCKINK